MVSKTRRRQIKRSNQESSFDQISETPNVVTSRNTNRQNDGQSSITLSNVEVETMIKNAVERELLKYGIDRNQNNSRTEVLNSSFRVNNLMTDGVGLPNVHSVRNTHFIANNGNNDRLRSRENNGPDPAALAPQTQTGSDQVDCHMATEMGLPGNGNKENRNANTETRVPRRRIPEFLTGNTLYDTTNDVMNSTMVTQDRPNNERVSSITRLADAITSRLPAPNSSSVIKPVTTSTLTFDGKNEKFELFEDWFNTLIKMQPGITESMKINQFHAHLRKGALQTFHNISSQNKNRLEDILVVFRRKYVKPESTATAKHKWHKLIFDPNKQSLPDFLEELHQGAEKAFGENAEQMIISLALCKTTSTSKKIGEHCVSRKWYV